MLCEDCKQKPATIHYTQVVGGVSREMHLCAACMQKRNVGLDLGDMQGLLSVSYTHLDVYKRQLPGKDGMVHISKLANTRVEKCEDVVSVGDELEVRVAEIDAQGRINLVRNDITYENNGPARPPMGGRPPRRDAQRRG